MEIMGIIGVIVNCVLIGLSGPVHRMFPDMTSTQTIILIIVLEHIMLLLKFLISAAIPDMPHHVEQVSGITAFFCQSHHNPSFDVLGAGKNRVQKKGS